MKIQTGTLLYAFLRPWVRMGARLFFRRISIIGKREFATAGPVILVANHQNAMLDPLLCCVFLRRQLHWLTRADVFKNGIARKILFQLNMLPVYRERDHVGDLRFKNENTFDICYQRMKLNAAIAMFPEGTHRGKKHLHTFKKGLARISFTAIREHNLNELCIQPVGLDYTNYFTPGGDFTMIIGEPHRVREFIDDNEAENAKAYHHFLHEMRHNLSKLMIHIDSDPYDELFHTLQPHYRAACVEAHLSTQDYLVPYIDKVHQWMRDPTLTMDFKNRYLKVKELSEQLKLNADADLLFPHSFVRLCLMPVFWIITSPLFLITAIYYPLYSMIERFIKKVIKDPLFPNSIRLVAWTFIAPLWTILTAWIFSICLPHVSMMAAFICMMASGIIAARLRFVWKDWIAAMHWAQSKRKFPDAAMRWKKEIEQLRKALLQK